MALVESAGPAYATSATNTVTTASFTPTAGALLVALASCGNGNGHGITAMSVTDSSGSGSWTLLAGTTFGSAAYAGVWVRDAFTGSGTVTFTGTPSTLSGVSIEVRQFTGAKPAASQAGVTALLNNTSAATLAITPGTTGSQVVGAFGTDSGAKVLTANGSTSIYGQYDGDPAGDTVAAFEATSLSAGGSQITLGFTNTAAVNAFALAEILPAATAAASQGRTQAIRAKFPNQVYALGNPGRIYGSVTGNRGDTSFGSGRVMWSCGAQVRNPAAGPVFRQAVEAVRAKPKLPPAGLVYASAVTALSDQFGTSFGSYFGVPGFSSSYSTGRISANYGTPPQNPLLGPVFRQAVQALRARVPLFRLGRVRSNPGAPVRDPAAGPVFRQATAPAQARRPLPPHGRVAFNPGAPVQNPPPVTTGPPFFPLRFPARARIPRNAPRGRTSSNPGAHVRNPVAGPVFREATGPVLARFLLPARGRIASNPGTAVVVPPVTTGPPFRYTTALRARVPLILRGRTASNAGAPVRNPARGPVFTQRTTPARSPLPQRPRTVQVTSSPGAPVPPESGWLFIGGVPLTYLQYLEPPDGTLDVTPGEIVPLIGPASGYPYHLDTPPPDGRWITVGGGGTIFYAAKAPETAEPDDDLEWNPPPHLAHLPIPFSLIAERITRKRQREQPPPTP